jgi:DNA-binding LytR/AlgR family response regulator
MSKITCLIVDDEPPALEILESHLRKVDHLQLVGKCRDAIEALNLLHQKPIDLLFLDIEMPELNGLELLQSLSTRPRVILTTAYREYALEGYNYEVVDYLLKPIRFQRFLQAVNRIVPSQAKITPSVRQPTSPLEPQDYIFVNINKKMHRIFLKDILYIESLGNYARIICQPDKLTVHRSMNALEDLLPQTQFLRIHKSYIVGLRHISAYTQTQVEIGATTLPIGGHYRLLFEQAIGGL